MSEPLCFGILGTGALGGYYGARLHHAGYSVNFLLRGDLSAVRAQGLKVESPHGDFSISSPKAYGHAHEMPPCDVLLLCAKTTANRDFLHLDLQSLLKPNGSLLILQNGMGYEEEFASHFPRLRVLGGMCFLCANRIGPGHIRHLDYGDIQLAALSPDEDSAQSLAVIAEAFAHAGIRTPIAPSLPAARWKKLVWNIPFNGLSVLLHAGTDELISRPASLEMVRGLMEEVVQAAEACGTPLPPHIVEQQLESTRRMTPYLPSMRLDWDHSRLLETEAIYDRPLARAAEHGCDMPRTRMLRDALVFLQQARGLLP